MAYQLYNDSESVRIVEDGTSHTLDKDYSIFVFGNICNIYFNDKSNPTWQIDYRNVTVPTVASAEALRSALEGWKTKALGTVTIDTTGLATTAKQDTGNASLGSINTKLSSQATAANQTTINTSINNLLHKNNGTFDAFYRQRFSAPETIFDSKQLNDNQPLYWDDQLVSGSGGASTYNANQASTTLSVANTTACRRVRQTFRRFNYQPGKSQLFIQTGVIGVNTAGIISRIGLFDDKNGVFFEQSEDGMKVVVRTYTSGSSSDIAAFNQADWNIDKMNGLGASGIDLDFSKTQIFFGDIEWLGVGTCRFGFYIDGRPYYVHEVNHANIDTIVYMSVPNLPLRYEIISDGTGAASSLTHICSTVISEGGHENTGSIRGVNRGATSLVTLNNTNLYPVIAVRLASTNQTAQVQNFSFSLVCTSTAAFAWYLIANPTVTGTALTYSAITNSSVEASTTSTNATTVSGGTIIRTNVSQQLNEASAVISVQGDYALGANIAGTSDVLVLAVQRLTGTTETFYAAMNWEETN